MNKYIIDNAKWLTHYNNVEELNKLKSLPFIKRLQKKKRTVVADVGCGNGRSIRSIRSVLPGSSIVAIDIIADNITYLENYENITNVEPIVADAKEYFHGEQLPEFDLVLFSWSFFDMSNTENETEKILSLEVMITDIKKHLKKDGYILVLQPTKGGSFEKILSLFIPGSDESYQFTHDFFKSHGFIGPNSTQPSVMDQLAIWSCFEYKEDRELYEGIASVLYLERGDQLSYEKYKSIMKEYKKMYGIENDAPLSLTDCVNIYYCGK